MPGSTTPLILLIGEDAAAWNVLQEAEQTLASFGVDTRRVEDGAEADPLGWLAGVARTVGAVVVASADGRLPGRWARATGRPTLRVPTGLQGEPPLRLLQDDQGQLPAGEAGGEFGTLAIGVAGAKNAALFVVSMLSLEEAALREQWLAFRARQTAAILEGPALKLEG